MKKTLVAILLTAVFVLALAVPAFAAMTGVHMTHEVEYDLDGDIRLNKRVGHAATKFTGGEWEQTIRGTGKYSKVSDFNLVQGKLEVSDHNDFVTAADAVRKLIVTSTLTLCAPSKYTYTSPYTGLIYDVLPTFMYRGIHQPRYVGTAGVLIGETFEQHVTAGSGFTALTANQRWSVEVEANQGYSGAVNQDFTAAYGRYSGTDAAGGTGTAAAPYTQWGAWADSANFPIDFDRRQPQGRSAGYVGDFFEMEQFARTSMGTLRRYIEISSPWSHQALLENFDVVGRSEVTESFNMMNVAKGDPRVVTATWHAPLSLPNWTW